MGKTLTDRLKIALGRQLSPKQMANAKEEIKRVNLLCSNEPKKIDELEKYPSGEFVRFRQRFQYMTTPDASQGMRRPHTGYYPYKTIVELYNSKGRIKQKTVSDGNLYIGGDHITRVFNPPGRLIGRRSKE